MKNSKIFILMITTLIMLSACADNSASQAPTPTVDINAVQTAVAQIQASLTQTVEEVNIPTPIPAETVIPVNLQAYESTQFNFSFLFPLDATRVDWEPANDLLLYSSLKYPSIYPDTLGADPNSPEISIVVFSNPDELSVSNWLQVQQTVDPESGSARYICVGVPQTLRIDNHDALIFRHSLYLAGGIPVTNLLIQNNQHIISLGLLEQESEIMRETFATVVSSFKFVSSADTIAVDTILQNEINRILDVLGPPRASDC
jgi:hypothetical protein